MKRWAGLRWTSSSSKPPSAQSRSRITAADWRGVVGGPSLSCSRVTGRGVSIGLAKLPTRVESMNPETAETDIMRWICESCGFIYDPDEGDPDGGIPPGTAFREIPDTWFCPVCGARKRDFVPYED